MKKNDSITITFKDSPLEVYIHQCLFDKRKVTAKILLNKPFMNWLGEVVPNKWYQKEEHFSSIKAAERWGVREVVNMED